LKKLWICLERKEVLPRLPKIVKETLQPILVAKASNSKELPSDTIGSDRTSSLNRFFKDINFIFFIDFI
jgi:hypothetical protein